MTYNETITIEKLNLAKNTNDKKIQKQLSTSSMLAVRKALAQNYNLDRKLANELLFDVSANVAYHASRNRNTTQQRSFSQNDLDHRCVTCELDIISRNCNTCTL